MPVSREQLGKFGHFYNYYLELEALMKAGGISGDIIDAIWRTATQCINIEARYQKARPFNSEYADKLYSEWISGGYDPSIINAFQQIIDVGAGNPNPSVPPQPSPPVGEVVGFDHIATVDNPIFAVGKPNGIHYGVYGKDQSEIYKLGNLPNAPIQTIGSESVISMCGKLATIENYKPNNVGAIMLYENGSYVPVFLASRYGWDLMLGLHQAPNGIYYATGMKFQSPNTPAGVLMSNDQRTWVSFFMNSNEYRFFDMDTSPDDGSLWTASTSSGADWGENNCNPCVFRNDQLIWRDTTRPNDGAWGIKCAFGDVFYGRTGHAAVVSVNQRRPVLEMPNHVACHTILYDEPSKTLIAFFSGDSGNAQIMGSKNGQIGSWFNIASLPCPGCWFGFQDPDTKEIYAGGGFWGGGGMLFRSRR